VKRTAIFTLAVMVTATAASAVGFGFGANYLLGIPIGEAKVTEYTGSFEGYSATVNVDMRDGLPLKMGMTNFGVGTVVNFVPMFGMEAGFEMHLKYNNKAATLSWTEEYQGDEYSGTESVYEDMAKWKMNNIYAGARFNLPFRGFVKAYADGGFLLIMGKCIALADGEETDDYIKGTNMGVYFGVGTNIFLSRNFAVNIPIKYNMPFAGTYKLYVYGSEVEGFEGKLKPPSYFTVGAGVEIHVM
jgi:hypothetical protein